MDFDSVSDEDLMQILQEKEVEIKQKARPNDLQVGQAIDHLYSRYADRLLAYFFYSLNRDREMAADFMQDLFVKLIEKPEAFDSAKDFKPWFFSVASNMCKNEYRRQGVDRKHSEYISAGASETETIPDKDDQIQNAINSLQDDYKSVIILRYKFKMSTKEIAEVLNCPAGTVRSKLFYATKELSKYIKR